MTNRSDPAGKARPGIAQGFAEGKSRPILAIETGGRACSVAIFSSLKDLPVFLHQHTDHGQATMLMPMIEQAMAKAGCGYADLDRIAVAVGPGSFTGIRVGLAAALGLSLASGVPAIGISSFLTVAHGAARERQDRRLFALLDSRREEPFLAELDAEFNFAQPPAVVTAEALDEILAPARPLILAGDAPLMGRYATQGGIRLMQTAPSALDVAMLAADLQRRFDLPPKPVYVRPPDATMPKPK
ncbi:tRNA (adenosine(37)-N6)-threonylcarbamoyltransferase complex dimerization subunit type 1 TsaB [Dongia sp. agr-C8]